MNDSHIKKDNCLYKGTDLGHIEALDKEVGNG